MYGLKSTNTKYFGIEHSKIESHMERVYVNEKALASGTSYGKHVAKKYADTSIQDKLRRMKREGDDTYMTVADRMRMNSKQKKEEA